MHRHATLNRKVNIRINVDKEDAALLLLQSGHCSQQSHALREAPLSQFFFVRAAVTLFLWGLEFMSVHQQPSRACNAEGIVSASKGLKESQQSRGTALLLQRRSYLPICSFDSVVKRIVKGNFSDNIEQWIPHFLHHLLLWKGVKDPSSSLSSV